MPETPIALLAGATGAVGGRLLERLLARDDGTRVLTVGRRAPDLAHPRHEHLPAALENLPAVIGARRCSEAYCCLGTTMKRAGSRAAFRAVDLDGVVAFAQAARQAGAEFFGLVSAAGATPDAANFYLRTKGEAEAAVEALGFDSLAILQPGVLRGPRAEFRAGEHLAVLAAPLTDRMLVGGLARFRSVAMDDAAGALERTGRMRRPGVLRLDPAAIADLAHAG